VSGSIAEIERDDDEPILRARRLGVLNDKAGRGDVKSVDVL
jgi:hypothetical protein